MMQFDRFALLFNSVSFSFNFDLFCFYLQGIWKKSEVNYAEYFALIFFILCGIILTSSFKSLLILFLGLKLFLFLFIFLQAVIKEISKAMKLR